MKSEFGVTTSAQQGITIPIVAASGIIASVRLHRSSARVVCADAASSLGISTALRLGALALHLFPAYLLTGLLTAPVVGSGFGTAVMGVLRTPVPRLDPAEREAVMAVIYAVSYLAFGVPRIIAGPLVLLIFETGRTRTGYPRGAGAQRRRAI